MTRTGWTIRYVLSFIFESSSCTLSQRTTLDRKQPFRSECIADLIYQYYGLAGREEANIAAAEEEFSKVPLNLIALVCNAVSGSVYPQRLGPE